MATLFYDERRVATGVLETVLERKPNRRTPGARKDPIRILYIVDQLTEMGGAERLLLKMIRSLPEERFRCSLVTFKIDRSLPLFSSLPCDVRVLPLRKSYDVQAWSCAASYAARALASCIHSLKPPTFGAVSFLASAACLFFCRAAGTWASLGAPNTPSPIVW